MNVKAKYRKKYSGYYESRHEVSVCKKGLRCSHEVLLVWVTASRDTAESFFQSCRNLVSVNIATIKRLRLTQARKRFLKHESHSREVMKWALLREVGQWKSIKRFELSCNQY